MTMYKFYIAGKTDAVAYAGKHLSRRGFSVTSESVPGMTHVLLDIPSFSDSGLLHNIGDPENFFSSLPENVTVLGGNLSQTTLADRQYIDLLQDAQYLAENAAITAECTLELLLHQLPVVLHRCPILVIGCGRIGKCLGQKLRSLGADVTMAARKEADRATQLSLGFSVVDTAKMHCSLARYRAIINTVPQPLLSPEQMGLCHDSCVKIDLASKRSLPGEDVLWARGLPGKMAPESSGILIARTILRLLSGKEVSV
jgi:dipicolinate synthase subunit A